MTGTSYLTRMYRRGRSLPSDRPARRERVSDLDSERRAGGPTERLPNWHGERSASIGILGPGRRAQQPTEMLSVEPGHQLTATSTKILSAAPNRVVERRAREPARRLTGMPSAAPDSRKSRWSPVSTTASAACNRDVERRAGRRFPGNQPSISSTGIENEAHNQDIECRAREPVERRCDLHGKRSNRQGRQAPRRAAG